MKAACLTRSAFVREGGRQLLLAWPQPCQLLPGGCRQLPPPPGIALLQEPPRAPPSPAVLCNAPAPQLVASAAQDPSGNPSWEGSSCLGEAPLERQGFTNRHLSLPIPCRVPPRAMCSGNLQTGLLVAGYFVYLLVGAAVFQALERTAEKQQKMAAAQMKEAFLQNFPHLTVAEMEQFMKNLTEAIQNGVYPVGNESQTENSNWDFSNSFFFAGTVVSTIGYGTLRPKTAGGQIFCVFFALFGIPLNIVFLHRVGKMLSLLCKKLGKFLYEKGMRKKGNFRLI
nr:potassium channel subfamily K member 16-like isoform X7 [Anas platyrhynchos]|eukprot:XP_027314449.1 potassium channel subfamily K member 16-like isoform X6 [Anas platyrhynchos]